MTLLYHPNIRVLFANRGITSMFSSPAVTLYSGTQPSSATIISSWSSYNNTSSNLLWHAPSGLTITTTNSITIYGSSFPAATNPVRDGTASWGIIWSGSLAYNSMGTSTIPNTFFVVAPVSSTTGNGVIKLNSTTLSTATAITIANFGFTVSI